MPGLYAASVVEVVEPEEPGLWVVAGCLFELSLPEPGAPPWQWRGPDPQVTLVASARRGRNRHLRFRGEDAGEVDLRFVRGDVERTVTVRIAPEADLA